MERTKRIAGGNQRRVSDVAVSADDGETWTAAALGENLGKYSFREWKANVSLEPASIA